MCGIIGGYLAFDASSISIFHGFMMKKNFIWILDEEEERKIFFGSMKSRVFQRAVLKIFGKELSRSELYKRSISSKEIKVLFEIECDCSDEIWKNYFYEVIEKGFLSPLISLVGGLFPNGSLAITLLVTYKIVDARAKKFELDGDFSSAVNVFPDALRGFDANALRGASSFEGVRYALFNERIQASTQVAAALAWDFDREGYTDVGSYEKLFLPDAKNQKGLHKCPQRVFYELLCEAVVKIDDHVGFKGRNELNIENGFFIDEGEKKKYLSGAKRFSLDEYDSKFRGLWPASYSDEIDKFTSCVASMVIFMSLSQAIYGEVKRRVGADRLGDELLAHRQNFQEYLSDLRANGERHMGHVKELIKGQMRASAL